MATPATGPPARPRLGGCAVGATVEVGAGVVARVVVERVVVEDVISSWAWRIARSLIGPVVGYVKVLTVAHSGPSTSTLPIHDITAGLKAAVTVYAAMPGGSPMVCIPAIATDVANCELN